MAWKFQLSPRQQTTYTGQPRLNNRCYSGVWAVVADCWPGRAEVGRGPGRKMAWKLWAGQAENFRPVHVSGSYGSVMSNVHALGVSLDSYHLAAVMHVDNVNLPTIKPQL